MTKRKSATSCAASEELGFEVSFTDRSWDFGRLYRSCDPDIVILDLAMPQVDGIELLHLLAQEHCRALILLMSGLDSGLRNVALRLGEAYQLNMAGIVTKPIRSETLRELLKNLRPAARLVQDGGPVASLSGHLRRRRR